MSNRPLATQLQHLLRLIHANRIPEARALGMRLRESVPKSREVLSMLGAIHGQLGEFVQAESCYRALVAIEPRSVRHRSHLGLGLSLVMQGRLVEALEPFDAMLKLQPGYAEGHLQMGCLLRDLGHHDAAIRHLKRAIELSPVLVEAAVYLANILIYQGKMSEALRLCDLALVTRPGFPEAIASKALILEKQGQQDQAWGCVSAADLDTATTSGIAIVYARLASRFGQADRARSVLERFLSRSSWAPSQRCELHFALAGLLDRAGDYDAAFAHYRTANSLSPHRFDPDGLRRKTEEIIRFFSEESLPAAHAAPQGSPVPLFIVGMPRSGTSLVEQILASHPDVRGAGELENLEDLERRAPQILGRTGSYPGCLSGVTAEAMATLARPYLDAIGSLSQGARYVTDKLPGNYERLGLIEKLFPDARIIHLVRDPRDTCLSCYFQNFGKNLTYSSDLQALGEVYRIYERLMDHWRSTLSIGILDIRYEALVTSPEPEVRRLLEFCELPWEPRCLEFHKSQRYINTASYDQVRQPLYRSSIGRWSRYEAHLGELIEALS